MLATEPVDHFRLVIEDLELIARLLFSVTNALIQGVEVLVDMLKDDGLSIVDPTVTF